MGRAGVFCCFTFCAGLLLGSTHVFFVLANFPSMDRTGPDWIGDILFCYCVVLFSPESVKFFSAVSLFVLLAAQLQISPYGPSILSSFHRYLLGTVEVLSAGCRVCVIEASNHTHCSATK